MEEIKVTFAQVEIPEFNLGINQTHRWLNFGDANRYPDLLIDLYNGAAKHAAIINGKCTYIAGSGFISDDPATQQFLAKANEKQSWDELIKILCKDLVLFGGYYLQCIKKNNGNGFNYYHLSYDRVRTNEDNTYFWYRKNWKTWNGEQKFQSFHPNTTERSSVFFFKSNYAKKIPYAMPDYLAALNLIAAEKAVAEAILTNAKSGFTATKIVTFLGQQLPAEQQREITKKLEARYSGESGTRLMVQFAPNADLAAKVEDLGQTDLTKEDYTAVNNLITTNLFSGHGVTHPLLFGIQQEGKLGSGTEIREAFYIFKNTYANSKQRDLEEVVKYFAECNGVNTFDATLKDVEPIDIEINPVDFKDQLPKEWVLEKLGIDLAKYGIAPSVAGVQPVAQSNDVLVNLTGRQQQQLLRIVSKFSSGKMTKPQAAIQLGAYGFTDEQINQYLGVDDDPTTDDMKFVDESEEAMIALFESVEFGSNANDYTVVSQQNFIDQDEFKFAFEAATQLSELETKIVALLKEKPLTTDDELAQSFEIGIEQIKEIKNRLAIEGIIDVASDGVVTKVTAKPFKVKLPDIKVMYSYEKRADVEGATLLPTSRPFCRKMVGLSQTKLFSREDIQKISERLGYSVFKRAGGFWNNNGKTEYQCRHGWIQKVVIKK